MNRRGRVWWIFHCMGGYSIGWDIGICGHSTGKKLINFVNGGEKEERIFAKKHNLFFVIIPQCIALVINSDNEGHF